MKNNKSLPLDKFIENTLYDKKKGYYSTKNPFGKYGDYITAPAISGLFSEMIAIWIISFWKNLNKPKKFNVVELGPGDGTLSKVLIKSFEKFPSFFKTVNLYLYERSNLLKKIQKQKLENTNAKWLKHISEIKSGPTIFFGNEFFDAIPIKQFKRQNKLVFEKYILLNNNIKSRIIYKQASKKTIKKLKEFKLLKTNGTIEFPELGLKELKKIVAKVKKFGGGILLIDYGYQKNQNINTLQSVKLHKKNEVFDDIGKADITSLVNFNLIKDYLTKKGLKSNKIVSQSFFLKRIGILKRAEIISHKMTFKEKSDLYYRLTRLLSPKHMGEIFKIIFAYKSQKKIQLGFK